jgi:hypothetical protein
MGTCHDEFTFVDSLQSFQAGRDPLQLAGRATQDNHFHANVVGQVGVQGGDDQVRVIVLQLNQLIPKLRAMVVIDQRERPGYLLVSRFPCPSRERISDQLPDGFATSCKLLLLAILVE